MKIAVIDYNSGNIASISNALKTLNVDFFVTQDAEEINKADKIIFPGVGHAANAMKNLKELNLLKTIKNLKKPFLGICLGMQILCNSSEEGDTKCLEIFDIDVKKFQSTELPVPHMGWNNVKFKDSLLFKNIPQNTDFYFVHSYYLPLSSSSSRSSATCNYIQEFSAAVQKENFYAVQFHPEKSGSRGLQLLKNFIELT